VFLDYLDKEKLSNFHAFNNRYWFYFHKTFFFVFEPDAVRAYT